MKNSRLSKESKTTNKFGFLRLRSLVVMGAIFTGLIGIGTMAFSESSTTVGASPQPTPQTNKKYIATRNTVVDRETGRLRKPTDQEVEELVLSLTELTKRSDENLNSYTLPGGGDVIDVDGGFAGVMLARPTADGTMETRCVFTFEEAAEFLGLVEDNS